MATTTKRLRVEVVAACEDAEVAVETVLDWPRGGPRQCDINGRSGRNVVAPKYDPLGKFVLRQVHRKFLSAHTLCGILPTQLTLRPPCEPRRTFPTER